MLATPDSGSILDIIGNSTRRRILAVLSQEPMYFNQLSKEIGIGQQSILRHMRVLEDSGIITSYAERSDLGAPDRKYYKLNSAFSLTISISEDTFGIKNRSIVESRYGGSKKFYKEFDSTPAETGNALIHMQSTLMRVEKEISDLELCLNDLRALKQLILGRLHRIGRETFEGYLEREVLYDIIEHRGVARKEKISGRRKSIRRRRSVHEIADTLNENEYHIEASLAKIRNKLEKNSAELLLGNLHSQ